MLPPQILAVRRIMHFGSKFREMHDLPDENQGSFGDGLFFIFARNLKLSTAQLQTSISVFSLGPGPQRSPSHLQMS
jgi:hypothetical protein